MTITRDNFSEQVLLDILARVNKLVEDRVPELKEAALKALQVAEAQAEHFTAIARDLKDHEAVDVAALKEVTASIDTLRKELETALSHIRGLAPTALTLSDGIIAVRTQLAAQSEAANVLKHYRWAIILTAFVTAGNTLGWDRMAIILEWVKKVKEALLGH